MSKRLRNWFAFAACLAASSAPVTADAEPIVTITRGNAEWRPGGGSVDVSGTDAFRLTALLSSEIGNIGCCFEPGKPLPFSQIWTGLDVFSPVVSLRGRTYTDLNTSSTLSVVNVGFSGTTIAPDEVSSPTSLTSPFTFSGVFRHFTADETTVDAEANLIGRGTATLFLQPDPDNVWVLSAVNVTFGDVGAAPIPEPGSILLIGIGLVGALGTARRRRTRREGPSKRIAALINSARVAAHANRGIASQYLD